MQWFSQEWRATSLFQECNVEQTNVPVMYVGSSQGWKVKRGHSKWSTWRQQEKQTSVFEL